MEEVIGWLMEFSFTQLKRLLEERSVPGLDWPSPVLTFNFPIPWDWEQWKSGQTDRLIHCEPLTIANTRTPKSAGRIITKAVVNITTFTVLHQLTNFVGMERKGNVYRPILSSDVSAKLALLKSKHAQDEAFDRLFHPFSIGAGSFSMDDLDSNRRRRFSKADLNALKEFKEPEILPPITCNVVKDGYKANLALCFQVHPFELNTVKKQASFPITVGIMAMPDLAECDNFLTAFDDPRLSVGKWPSTERRQFWTLVLNKLAELRAKHSGPSDEIAEETIVEVRARVKIAAQKGKSSDAANSAFTQMLSSLQGHGEVIQADFCRVEGLSSNPSIIQKLSSQLEQVNEAKGSNARGKVLEELMASLLETVTGFEIKQREQTATEEIDLVVVNSSNEARWRQSGPLILFECKNWSSNCGKADLVQFETKIRNRRGACNLGFLVSWKGFGAKLKQETLRSSREDYVIGLIDGNDIRDAVAQGSLLPILQRSWEKAVLV